LSGEDERKRLIPVLKTMLKLTNDEVMKLEDAAKGSHHGFIVEFILIAYLVQTFESHLGQNSGHRPGSSWSSYIPVWSSSEK